MDGYGVCMLVVGVSGSEVCVVWNRRVLCVRQLVFWRLVFWRLVLWQMEVYSGILADGGVFWPRQLYSNASEGCAGLSLLTPG